jgi:hypothetical protein
MKFNNINKLVLVSAWLPITMRRAAAFAAGFRSKLMVLRKTALLIGNTATSLPRDFPLFLHIHGSKAAIRGVIILSHGNHRVVVCRANR